MMKCGTTKEEIEKMKYYNSLLFLGCIEREVPPPTILYWRVRTVFAMYGPMIDSLTQKAKGVLNEILLGYYSDLHGMCMYMKKMKQDGSVKVNKYGMEMIESIHGTNQTKSYHQNLILTFRNLQECRCQTIYWRRGSTGTTIFSQNCQST
jgi:hypothetical protein